MADAGDPREDASDTRADGSADTDEWDAVEPDTDESDAAEGGRVAGAETASDGSADDLDALRAEVEERYDFENFTPEQMAEMSVEEWEAAFDPDAWIVGEELLDRVEKDLRNRVASRDVFAVVERIEHEGEPRIVAYADEGYAIVYPDGSVEGRGTVLRDVKPTVALASMEDYEIDEPPEDASLPDPDAVAEGSGEFGNLMLQIIAVAQILAGIGLLVAWVGFGATLIAAGLGVVFLGVGFFLFTVVANARLSDRFRAEEFRDRLRATGVDEGRPPEFLPEEARPSPANPAVEDATEGEASRPDAVGDEREISAESEVGSAREGRGEDPPKSGGSD